MAFTARHWSFVEFVVFYLFLKAEGSSVSHLITGSWPALIVSSSGHLQGNLQIHHVGQDGQVSAPLSTSHLLRGTSAPALLQLRAGPCHPGWPGAPSSGCVGFDARFCLTAEMCLEFVILLCAFTWKSMLASAQDLCVRTGRFAPASCALTFLALL